MKEILYQFNPWWEGKFKVDAVEREKYRNKLLREINTRDILFLIGLRRVGKTTIMYQLIENLLKTIEKEKILYVSLDHPIFGEYSLLDILREFRKIHGLTRSQKLFLFFDEIHMKEGFERELKILYDTENVKVIASGSSSLAIKHKGSFLTGRYKKISVEPADFDEFLRFRGIRIKESEMYLLERYLEDYLKTGGMPEYILRHDPEYIIELADSIVYKDIVGRYGIKNPDILKKLFLLLAERVGKKLTYNKLANILGISVDAVKQYVSYFEESFLAYAVQKYAKSLNERIYSPKKIYFADVGVRNVFTGFKDIGAVVENIVFLKLKSLGNIYYYSAGGKEIDFIVDNTAVETKYKDEITPEDLKALETAKIKKKMVISKSTSRHNKIDIIPLVEFLRT